MELPGIEPAALPGLLLPYRPVRYVSFRFSPVRYLRFRFRVLTASRVTYPRRATARLQSHVENLLSDFYDDLALCTPLLDVGQRFGGRLKGKDPVYDGTNSTGIDERAELA